MAINYIRQCPVYERKCTSSPGGWQEITQTAFSLLFNALQMSMLICLHLICHGTRHTLDNKPLWLWIDPQIRLQRGCVHAKTHTRLESILFEALYLFEVGLRVEDGSFLMRYTRREMKDSISNQRSRLLLYYALAKKMQVSTFIKNK